MPAQLGNALHPDFARWLIAFYESLGWNPGLPVYDDMLIDAPFWAGQSWPVCGPNSDTTTWRYGKLQNRYREGSDLEPYIEWSCAAAEASKNFVFVLEWRQSRVDGSYGSATVDRQTISVPNSAQAVRRTTLTTIIGTDYLKGDLFTFKLYRDADHASDDYSDNILIMKFGVKIQVEGIGDEEAHPS